MHSKNFASPIRARASSRAYPKVIPANANAAQGTTLKYAEFPFPFKYDKSRTDRLGRSGYTHGVTTTRVAVAAPMKVILSQRVLRRVDTRPIKRMLAAIQLSVSTRNTSSQ